MSESIGARLLEVIGDAGARDYRACVVERLSKDFYWYSPVLKRQLESKHGDIVVQPVNVDEVLAVARYAGEHGIPCYGARRGTGQLWAVHSAARAALCWILP
jgi:FAD/FMN-containing dehydrogenase